MIGLGSDILDIRRIEKTLLSSIDTPNVDDIFKVLLNKCLERHK